MESAKRFPRHAYQETLMLPERGERMRLDTRRLSIVIGACAALVLSMAPPAGAQAGGWQPGPGAIGDNTYSGNIDQPSNGATVPGSGSFPVSGWFVDSTAQGWAGADNVQVWLGTMDGGGSMIAQASVAQGRPDVATALGNPYWVDSGFAATVNGSSVPGGGQTLNVYVHTPGKGWWFMPLSVTGGGPATTAAAPAPAAGGTAAAGSGPPTLVITQPTEGANVPAKGGSSYSIMGVATDPSGGANAIDVVDVWMFGERNADGATQLGTATPDSAGNWSVSFTPTKFPSTHVNIYVYAHSKLTGQTTEVVRGFNIQG
jgi:hypothetical protein